MLLQEIIEGEHTQLNHDEDVLSRCRCIMEITKANIDRGIFPDGYDVRQILDVIMAESRGTLIY